MFERITIASKFGMEERAVIFPGDCRELLHRIPAETVQLVVTSPPYNLGKEYEKRLRLAEYAAQQREIIRECVRVLKPNGSICWQVGNYVESGAIIPLDSLLYPVFAELGLRMRNRIVWHFEHGLHCSRRLSGRYEVILWFTKGDDYVFDLDPIRIPPKISRQEVFQGAEGRPVFVQSVGEKPGRCVGDSKREEQSRGEDRASLPVPGGID